MTEPTPIQVFAARIARAFAGLGVVAIMLALLAAPHSNARAQGSLKIAAVVNDEAISFYDLDMRITLLMASSGMENTIDNRRRLAAQVLRGLIDERLMAQEARRLDIIASEEMVSAALQRIEQQNSMPPGEMTRFLKRIGVPMSIMVAKAKTEISWQLLLQRTLLPKIEVSEEEISEHIALIQSNAGRPQYHLAEVFLPVNNPANDANVRSDAERLVQQLKGGASFPALARNFSRAPSASVGGDLGWVQPGQMSREIEEAVLQLKPGQTSVPVKALGGYYILFLRDQRVSPGLSAPDAEVRISQLHLPLGDAAGASALSARLVAISQNLTSCADLEKAGEQTGSPMSGSLGTVKMSGLPPEMRAALEALPENQPSAPLATGGGLAVLMVCERLSDGGDDAIRNQIRERLTMQRLEIDANRAMRDLRRNAFIDMRL